MTYEQFFSAISDYLDAAIHNQGYPPVIDHGQIFSTLLGGSGPAGLGNLSAILQNFGDRINHDKAKLGLSNDFIWNKDLKTPTVPIVVDYYINKSIVTLVNDTVSVLRPLSSSIV